MEIGQAYASSLKITLVLIFRPEQGVFLCLRLVRSPLLLLAGGVLSFGISRFKKALGKSIGTRSVIIYRRKWSVKFPLTLLI